MGVTSGDRVVSTLAGRPLDVVVVRSGGLSGVRRHAERTVEPGSDGHDAALVVLRAHRFVEPPPPRRPDGFSYDVRIASPGRTVLHRVFRDPVPDDVAVLLAAMLPG